ncbi:unnamed protein product [Brassica oleracea]|uniref:(rape) hypothetical protein n=1 Tax=Brassica napus TaxID=3708 RepID=A0A816IAP0_BRANA|nr:unnamed protein product [Brassica napus]
MSLRQSRREKEEADDVFDGTQIGDALNGTPEMAKLMAICRTNDGDLWEQRRKVRCLE